ncbi:hypothetical protein [Polaromonas jejuensis]|uniref:Uncharacterized protein n=1 Tax=Polaromonas jejuensis TaxID=457502 RepID=A0ABW0QC17_9BURK
MVSSECPMLAYSVEKLNMLAASRARRKADLSNPLRIDDRDAAKGSSAPQNLATGLLAEFFNSTETGLSPKLAGTQGKTQSSPSLGQEADNRGQCLELGSCHTTYPPFGGWACWQVAPRIDRSRLPGFTEFLYLYKNLVNRHRRRRNHSNDLFVS